MKLTKLSRATTIALSSIALSTALSAAISLPAHSAEEEKLVITASKTKQDINDTLASITIIDRNDIERIQPESFAELLENLAGIDVVRQGGAGQNTAIFTRGSESDHTLIVVDGVRVGSATSGLKNVSNISVSLIERVEIVRGPRAALWGSDAIGAVIQIFTRQLDNGNYIVDLSSGSESYNKGELSFGFGGDRTNNTVTLSSETSEGFDVLQDGESDADGYRRVAGSIRGDYELSDRLSLNWVAQLEEGNAEFDSSFGGNETDYKNHLWNIQYTYDADEWVTQLSVKQSKDDAVTYGNGNSREQGAIFETRRNQINASAQYLPNDQFTLVTGIERYEDEVFSSRAFVETERTTDAVYVYSAYTSDSWLLDASIRNDNIDKVDDDNSFNVSVGYRLNDEWLVSLSRGKGFKAPTFNDLYFPDSPFFGGNPDLVSERSFSNEVNFKGNFDEHSLVISLYNNDVDNLINFESDAQFVTRPVNVDRAEITGKELVYQYNDGKFQHKFDFTFLKSTNLSSQFREPLIRRAEEQVAYQFGMDLDQWNISGQVKYVGDRPDRDFSQFPAPIVTLESYHQFNLGVAYQVNEKLKLNLKVNDVTDKAPVQVLTYNSLGRQIFVGFNYRNH